MATISNFITEDWIKENTPATANIDPKELKPFIRIAQDIYIQDLLGGNFYEHLMDAVAGSSLTSDETTLLKLIRPALAWYTVLESLPYIATKIRNIGVVEQNGENLINTQDSNLKYLRSDCKQKAEYYMKRVSEYLCTNGNLFPTYTQWVNGKRPPNQGKSFTGGLAFDCTHPNYVDYEFFKKYIFWK